MGPWLVLASPCFRENVVATCKIGPFLCSVDSLFQENLIVLFFGNQISKWRFLLGLVHSLPPFLPNFAWSWLLLPLSQ